jgi:hypothetical protein
LPSESPGQEHSRAANTHPIMAIFVRFFIFRLFFGSVFETSQFCRQLLFRVSLLLALCSEEGGRYLISVYSFAKKEGREKSKSAARNSVPAVRNCYRGNERTDMAAFSFFIYLLFGIILRFLGFVK